MKDQGNPFVNAYEWFDYGALLEAFSSGAGLPKLSAQPRVYIQPENQSAVDQLKLPPEYCVIHRVSNDAKKDWTEAKWDSLLTFLTQEAGIPVVEVGAAKGPRSAEAAEIKTSRSGRGIIDLIDKTNLLETAEVIRRARFFIGIDSGPAHFANAVRTPGIVLLGRLGYFRQYTPFTGFYASTSPEVRIVRNFTGCVAEIPANEVIEASRYLLSVLEERQPSRDLQQVMAAAVGSAVDHGYRRRVLESGFFDQAWYVTHYPEALEAAKDPLDYFIARGEGAGHSPGPGFDADFYRAQRPDLGRVSDPLRHFLTFGLEEGLRPGPEPGLASRETPLPMAQISTALVELTGPDANGDTEPRDLAYPRLFAFYLPQFHPITENNWGHRPGFTEWDNVIKAKPLFRGHYQPRIPGELGYYDLRSLDVMRQQIELANEHGIDGFCFYYYSFNGKKLLYAPIDNYIKSDIKAPFLFLWANENWTKRWDGGDNEVIVAQNHSPQDDFAFIKDLLPIFSDDRYVKIDGKPILPIYKAHLFPDILQTTERFRDQAVKYGFPGLYLVTVDDWTPDPPHPREIGFDASYEIPSNLVAETVLSQDTEQLDLREDFEGKIVDYWKFASYHMARPFPVYKRFRTVMAPWDNTPRYGSRAMVHINTDNDAFRIWLLEALLDTYKRNSAQERIVFLHSWNEWCEGTYIEPDGRQGRRYLEETRDVTNELRSILNSYEWNADPSAAAHLVQLMRVKEEGASRTLQAMRQELIYLRRAHEQAQDAARRAEGTIEGIRRSKSWRLTEPLRIVQKLRRKS